MLGCMSMRPDRYRARVIDPVVDRLLGAVGAVSIEGPKWCGKTWTSLNHANSVYFVSDPSGGFANRTLAELDLAAALHGEQPHAIDEWQEVPGIWDAVRFDVDANPSVGRFLLTGSSTPSEGAVAHSGTGRIVRLRMRPMTLFESGESTGIVSLSAVLDGEPVTPLASRLTLDELVSAVIRGGWPASLGRRLDVSQDLAESYLDGLARVDVSQVDGVRRDPAKVMALLRSLARNTSTTVSLAAMQRDIAQAAGPELDIKTLGVYLGLLERLYVVERIPAWNPALRSPVKLRQAPKWMLVDPSLAVAGMQSSAESLKREPKTLGFLFESLMMRDLLVYAQQLRATLWHYRDDADLEVDAILTLPNGAWVGVEVKLGHQQVDQAASTLLRLRDKMLKAGDPAPAAMIVLVGVGGIAQHRDDGVIVIPADSLGP